MATESTANATAASIRAGIAADDFAAAAMATADTSVTAGGAIPTPGSSPAELTLTGNAMADAFVPSGYTYVQIEATAATVVGAGQPGIVYEGDVAGETIYSGGGFGAVVLAGANNVFQTPTTNGASYAIASGIAVSNAATLTLADVSMSGGNLIVLGGGNDSAAPGLGANTIFLGAGNDLIGSEGDDTLIGGTGSATVEASGNALFFGQSNAATLYFINDEGRSTIVAGSASTFVTGGTGSVEVWGNTGGGVFNGGSSGNNTLVGGALGTELFGGGNGDLLVATGSASQSLFASDGSTTLFGSSANGADDMILGTGADVVVMGAGADTVDANNSTIGGTATIYGGSGTGSVTLGAGIATVVGGFGAMLVEAGSGSATAFGGSGVDTYAFPDTKTLGGLGLPEVSTGTGGALTIVDFRVGIDKLAFAGFGGATEAIASQSSAGGSTMLLLVDGTRIDLVGVASLPASSASFA